jgi:hypothetical protein
MSMRQRYFAERENSGAPGNWLSESRIAQTGVACDVLLRIFIQGDRMR